MNARPSFLLVLLLTAALGLPGCGGESPEAHFEQGKALLAKGDRKGAIVELKNTLQSQPDNMEARLLLGEAHLAAEAHEDAEKELRQALEKGADAGRVLPLLAKALLALGQNQKLLDLGIPTHTFTPDARAALLAARSEAQFRLDQREEAGQSLAEAEAADPNHPDLLLLKARNALRQKDAAQAGKWLDALLKQSPNHVEGLYLKGALLAEAGKRAEALEAYGRLAAADPGQFRAHLARHALHVQDKNDAEAEKDLQAAEKLAGGNPMVKYARGVFELQRGKADKASAALTEVLRQAPEHLPSQLAYALASYGQGNYEQSLSNAEKVLAALPDNLIAAKLAAGSHIKLGNAEGARKILDPLLPAHADDAALLALAGEAHLRARDYNKAMAYLDRAAALDPANAAVRTQMAAGRMALGDNARALADLEKAAGLSDKPGQADVALVLAHLRNKAYDPALRALDSLERKLPDNPVIHNLRASALLGKGDRPGARQALEQALKLSPGFFVAALNLARMDMEDGKPDAARARFESVLKQDKTNLGAMLALADLAGARNNGKERADWLEKAVQANPGDLSARSALIRHHLGGKANDQALRQARQAAGARPDDMAAQRLLGGTQLAVGDAKGAVETFARVALKSPRSAEAQRHLGAALLADKQLDAARAAFNEALRLKPDDQAARDALMRLDLHENKGEAALASARQLQAQQPRSPVGFDREGDILLTLKRPAQAAKAYEQALAKGAAGAGLLKLHRALVLAGDAKAADQRLSGWLKQHPDDLPVRAYAAEYHMQGQRNREAIALYEGLVKARPDHFVALNNLATLYQRERDPRAPATAEQALKLAPSHPGVQDTLGWILAEQGQLPRALDLLAKAAAQAPKVVSIRYHYGAALAKAGRKAEARKELEAALAGNAVFPEREEARGLLKSL